MPKRLLRYALSRLELLDAEALDMENLDLALGRNTVFEFRDVGIKLKKLEKLLQLPPTFRIQKSKVLLLRVTIPMDFYTSPIIVEVDGVDIALQVLGTEPTSSRTPGTKTPEETAVVPNTVDLAQSFLETQPSSERRKLEDALVAETQDLGASVTASEDGSEEDWPEGTGQPLSLPTFLADFLQGIVDRTQIKIKGIKFQLGVEVPIEPTSTTTEPVSFQVTFEDIDVEGVTTYSEEQDGSSTIVPKEGKRHISLSNVRAYLVSEANVFSALARSPSMTSPSVASSPVMTRNPPSRQASALSSRNTHDEPSMSMQASFRDHVSEIDDGYEPDSPVEDSEEALSIPYELSDPTEEDFEESPATPKASMYHDFNNHSPERLAEDSIEDALEDALEEPLFHSTIGRTDHVANSFAFEDQRPHWANVEREARSAPNLDLPFQSTYSESSRSRSPSERLELSVSSNASFGARSNEDLAESHVYTHEEAESMYMSAFSTNEQPSSVALDPAVSHHTLMDSRSIPDLAASTTEDFQPTLEERPVIEEEIPVSNEAKPAMEEVVIPDDLNVKESQTIPPVTQISDEKEPEAPMARPQTPRAVMPGAWDDDADDSPPQRPIYASISRGMSSRRPDWKSPDESDSDSSSPAFSRACIADIEQEVPSTSEKQQDDVPTPKGPTRLVKEILSLKSISIYVPSHHTHVKVHGALSESVAQMSQSMGRSVYPQAPGAFSVHGATSASPRSLPTATEGKDDSLEITLSPISINFDASLGFLLTMVVGRLLEALKDDKPPAPTQKDSEHGEAKKAPEVKVKFEEIKLSFLNRLGGVTDTSERYLDPTAFIFDQEVLLSTTLQNLSVAISPVEIPSRRIGRQSPTSQPGTLTRIDLQKFRFGYANGDIISFDSGKPMSTSVRDTFLSSGTDISIKILQSGDNIKTDIETLPLVVQIDLQRLDETFSWFGGLSSFLNMSASMASSPSPTPKPLVVPLQQKPRGVRFDTPINPSDKSAAADNKVNLRAGGAYLELLGRDCSVSAETTALKLVSRDEGIGMACTVIRVSGPFLKNSSAEPAITCEVTGLRLDFLTAPQDKDLEKLLELIIPTKVKFDHGDDEIMVDTLLRQRRKGSVLRASVEAVNVRVQNMAQLSVLPNLGEEVAKLSTVAKYLPEDDRPGLLTLGEIQKISVSLDFGGRLGHFGAEIQDFHVGQITVPSLIAIAIHGISVKRNKSEELVSNSTFGSKGIPSRGPVIMARMIGDEMEPVIKLKMQDVAIEYRVSTIMDLLDLAEDATPQDFEASLAASVANLGDQAHHALVTQPSSPSGKSKAGKPMTLDIGFRDCLIGLNPLGKPSKMVIALTDARLVAVLPEEVDTNAVFTINKAAILLIDDIAQLSETNLPTSQRPRASSSTSRQVVDMCTRGFVDISYISSAKVVVDVKTTENGEKLVDIELRDDLFVLETCADSTQTLIALANALKPPTPPSKQNKYRTKIIPIQDLLASVSAEAFGKSEGDYDFDQDFAGAQELAGSGSDTYSTDSPLQVESQFYQQDTVGEELFDATSSSIISHRNKTKDDHDDFLLTDFDHPSTNVSQGSEDADSLSIHEGYYGRETSKHKTAKVWNSNMNTYDKTPIDVVNRSPVKVCVRDVHVIWNLFDGYDWVHTRDIITKAVQDVETKAFERQNGPSNMYEDEFEEEEAIGDFLFNSIYIGIPANRDPHDLARAINEGLNDNVTETESIATTALTSSTNRTVRSRQPRSKKLKLKRSRRHKITFELRGVDVDLVAYPEGFGETLSSIDVKVKQLDIFDHVPTSTWRKFATYDQDMGEREMGTSMVHLQLLNIKPQQNLGASDIVLRVKVLPLRLHVDQDALDFITRFFEFKDDDAPVHASPSDVPFISRVEVFDIPVKLDFKPKRVDYAGLRSGHTTEFMNFIVLEEATLVLRHIILYGVTGFDRMGKELNACWMPDVQNTQLPGVLGGLAPLHPFVGVGRGVKQLVEVPLREYKKDGRVIRSISKGATAFARTTGTGLVKLGAKLAVGTQYALQGAEGMLTDQQQHDGGWEEDEFDEEDRKQISLYADQPTGVMAGIRGGYRSLARDMNTARDAIIAVPGEVMSSASATGAAKAVLKRAPTIIFRPAVGVSKAIGQTLMGATNSIDPHNMRRVEEKYKKH